VLLVTTMPTDRNGFFNFLFLCYYAALNVASHMLFRNVFVTDESMTTSVGYDYCVVGSCHSFCL